MLKKVSKMRYILYTEKNEVKFLHPSCGNPNVIPELAVDCGKYNSAVKSRNPIASFPPTCYDLSFTFLKILGGIS